jgi:regulator of cell morphogenesis and NO signaling
MSPVAPSQTLDALVAERPGRAAVFERLRLDYCCGGADTLADACRRRGLDLATVQTTLEISDADADADLRTAPEDRDWRQASISELCAHIVTVHHDEMRQAFSRIDQLFATVIRVHGASHPELHNLQHAFGELRSELEPHLRREEDLLFPACRALELGGRSIDETLLAEHEQEHGIVGDALKALRLLSADYDPGLALCNTHRTLLKALAEFERDLHRHVHEENNILIPRVRELGANPRAGRRHSDEQGDSLPRCCQAWIAEQSHSWAQHRG